MRAIFIAIGKLFKFFGVAGKYIPVGITAIFLLTQFIVDWFFGSFNIAIVAFAKSILATELVINEKVHLAISGSEKFGTIDILQILLACFVFYFLITRLAKIILKLTGSNQSYGAYLIALAFVIIIEISVIKMVDGSFGFVPIRDSFFFLFQNLQFVFINFHLFA